MNTKKAIHDLEAQNMRLCGLLANAKTELEHAEIKDKRQEQVKLLLEKIAVALG